jgi:3-hydroxyisobutyrate dehydrogenase-like beta-hydroxyacid dehydrogenase
VKAFDVAVIGLGAMGSAALCALADDYDRRTSNRRLAADKIKAT